MITETTQNEITFFQFNIGCYCFLAFTLSDLLKSIPKEYKNQCLTQLN